MSAAVAAGEVRVGSIPERRLPAEQRVAQAVSSVNQLAGDTATAPCATVSLSQPVWRCRVCGYLCARPAPPAVCPICKVTSDRFERFI